MKRKGDVLLGVGIDLNELKKASKAIDAALSDTERMRPMTIAYAKSLARSSRNWMRVYGLLKGFRKMVKTLTPKK